MGEVHGRRRRETGNRERELKEKMGGRKIGSKEREFKNIKQKERRDGSEGNRAKENS